MALKGDQDVEHLAARERTLPAPAHVHVQRKFEDYRKCGHPEHGVLRVRCAERLVAFSWPLLRIPALAA